MSLLDGYTEVTGQYQVAEGQRVRLTVQFLALPLVWPSRDDFAAALASQVDLTVDRIDVAPPLASFWGVADAPMTAAEFQDQLVNMAGTVNQASLVGIRLIGSPVVEVLDAAAPPGAKTSLGGLGLGLGFGAVLAVAVVIFVLLKR